MSEIAGSDEITFTLVCRLSTEWQIALVLHLYRGERQAIRRTLMTIERGSAASALKICRTHLIGLGIRERQPAIIEGAAPAPSSDNQRASRLPAAAQLH